MLSAGVQGVGQSFALGLGAPDPIYEWAGFGQSANNNVLNNLFWDLGSTEYNAPNDGHPILNQNTNNWLISHNTAGDVKQGFLSFGSANTTYQSNVLTPYRSSCSAYGGRSDCANPAATNNIGNQDASAGTPFPAFVGNGVNGWCPAVANGDVGGSSSFSYNMIMNAVGDYYYSSVGTCPGHYYPTGTYLVQATDTISGSPPSPNLIFQVWNERNNSIPPNGLNYRSSNFRLLPGISGPSGLFPAADPAQIGADIDQIEALTGPSGIDVELGNPPFFQQSARNISVGATSAVLSYLPNGSACTVEVWNNQYYSGSPAINTSDSGANVLSGVLYLPLTGLSASVRYWGKRWCGTAVDVFSFTTGAATPALALQLVPLPGTAGCQVEYGPTPALGSSLTAATVTNGDCSLTIPAAAYWRADYLSPTGIVVSRGNIQGRGL
jgi:hypothetical protein